MEICCHYKCFQLEIGGGGGWFLIIISYLLYCLYVAHLACCVEWSNSAELETVCSYNMAATPIPVPVAMPGYSAVHNM